MRCKACQGFITSEYPPGMGDELYHHHCEQHIGLLKIERCSLCDREKVGTSGNCAQCDGITQAVEYECLIVDLYKELQWQIELKELALTSNKIKQERMQGRATSFPSLDIYRKLASGEMSIEEYSKLGEEHFKPKTEKV